TTVITHPNAVAEDGATAEHARRVDGEHACRSALVAVVADQCGHERALAAAGRSGHAEHVRPARVRVQRGQCFVHTGRSPFHVGQHSRDRWMPPRENSVDDLSLHRHGVFSKRRNRSRSSTTLRALNSVRSNVWCSTGTTRAPMPSTERNRSAMPPAQESTDDSGTSLYST